MHYHTRSLHQQSELLSKKRTEGKVGVEELENQLKEADLAWRE